MPQVDDEQEDEDEDEEQNDEEEGSANPTAANCLHLNNGHVRVVRLNADETRHKNQQPGPAEEVEKHNIYCLNVAKRQRGRERERQRESSRVEQVRRPQLPMPCTLTQVIIGIQFYLHYTPTEKFVCQRRKMATIVFVIYQAPSVRVSHSQTEL